MSALIALSRVALAAPDGRPLLSNLDLSLTDESIGLVGRNGVGKSSLLAVGERRPASGSVAVSGRVGLLR